MKCKTCNSPTELRYNGFPLCHDHYAACIQSRTHRALTQISPIQQILLFGDEPCLRFVYDQLLSTVSRYQVNPRENIVVCSVKVQNYENFIHLQSDSYIVQLAECEQICTQRSIPALVDCSSGDEIAKQVLRCFTKNELKLAVQVAKQTTILREVNVLTVPTKIDNLKFVPGNVLKMYKPLLQIGKNDI